ncbi:MAG: alpha/beta hydrolase [Fuerstiella sp.]
MFRSISSFFLAMLLATSCWAEEATTTTWRGTLDARGTKLRLEIDITPEGKTTHGQLRSLDQNNATSKLDEIKTEGRQLSFSIPQLRASFSGSYNADKTEATGIFRQGGAELPLTLTRGDSKAAAPKEKFKEAWVGKLDMGIIKPVMQFRVMKGPGDRPLVYFDSITEGQTGFAGTWSIKEGELLFEIPPIRLKFRGELNDAGDSAEGTWSQGGRDVPLTLKRQPMEYDRKNVWENRPQRPVAPFSYDAEEVTFENKIDKLTLAGTLTVPKKSGKHPAVILISGSGPQDRDESLMEHKPFLVLADYLSRRGVAVLRYDDRGTAKSTGKFGPATTEDFAKDASAAVEFLKQHPRINAEEIGLAGHSEGGLIVPMVCGLREDVAFVVLLAATGVDGLTIIHSQTAAMLRVEKSKPEEQAEVNVAISMNKLVIERAVKGELDLKDPEFQMQIDALIQLLPEEDRDEGKSNLQAGIESAKKRLASNWMKFFISYDPRPALSRIKCPILVIIGSKDLQVLPDLNMPEIKKALASGGNKDVELVTLPGLNHLFQKCETGSMNEYASIQETFNPEALQKIGDWIVGRTTVVK